VIVVALINKNISDAHSTTAIEVAGAAAEEARECPMRRLQFQITVL
jgi:hypothetical protein